tara:strand:- start:1548 stop:2942 length:1395 start_codon:yes stop_codon:yes gene_type:complete
MFAEISRRQILARASSGFGLVALSGLLAPNTNAALPKAKAKNVILCYMSGGVSHVDSFDPKPRLKKEAGQEMPMKVERTQFNNNGKIMPSPFAFRNRGESGLPVSEIFEQIGDCADDIAVIRSMTTPVNEHAQGNFMIHSGFPFLGHPSAGAWMSYGLGSANENLPSYVVLQSGHAVAPHGGVGLFSSGFLPAQHQASIIKADNTPAIPNVAPSQVASIQRSRLDFVNRLDQGFAKSTGGDADVEAAIMNYETAFRMQSAVPEVCDLRGESEITKKLYGLDDPDPEKAAYARQAILARRLVERGVRFVELSCLTKKLGAGGAPNPWDQHGALEEGHRAMGQQVDQPIAALIKDLKQRGMLDETLIIFTGEFGRTPFSQGSNGRDHNPFGFSVWMAGGGIKGGTAYGATDDYGYHVVDGKATIFDLWATVLHQVGIDHEDLTYRYAGRDVRLTDVHGNVLHDILA